MLKLILDKANEGGSAGGKSFPTPPKSPEQQPPAANAPPVETTGPAEDDFGYQTVPAEPQKAPPGPAPKAGDKPPEAAPKETEDPPTPGTGYGTEPPKVEEPPAAAPAEPPPTDELDKSLVGLPKAEAGKIKEFLSKHKVEGEVLKAFVDMRKQEFEEAKVAQANREKQFEQEKLKIRAQWHKELKDDPVFGGEKFLTSVSRAEKVLDQVMPLTKKELTERKSVLPPYVMRDLANLFERLWPTEPLVQGEPTQISADDPKEDDALSFYNS